MEINITKETLKVNKIVCEKKENINIQGDMIVPDSKPDILNTINTTGNVCIYKKEVMDSKIKIDGNILAYIMYLAENDEISSTEKEDNQNNFKTDNIRGLSTNLDFSETINIPELESEMNVDIIPTIKSIECKVINGRKIGIKVILEIKIKIYSNETIEIIADLNNENIQVLTKNIKINSLLGEGSTKASVKENISIPSADNLAEILSAQISLVDKDIKISYNKVLAKSEIEIKMVYLTEEGKICTTQNRVPLVGFIDMPDIKEENICEQLYNIKNIVIKPNSAEEHSVYLEMEVEIFCTTYEEKEIKIIQDMYCPRQKMNYKETTVNTMCNKKNRKDICNIREKMNISELETGKIIDVVAKPIINKENRANGKVYYEGEIDTNIIFTDNSAVGINTKKVQIPFEQSIEETEKNSKTEINVEVNAQEFINQNGIISANIDLNFETNSYVNSAIPVISDITMEDEEELEDYSVIIYVVKNGDTLWKIAKKFGSTVDDIARVNGIQNPDKIGAGEKIYIPKYVIKKENVPIIASQNV